MISEDSENADSSEGVDSVTEGENKKRGMVLPFEPHSITFDDVVYSVDMPPVTIQNLALITVVRFFVFFMNSLNILMTCRK